ncbi:MAG TPA: nuclear transport factor 2 family protein [Bryobacteraceae bacterium]|nr:nuclear transport factor 2 family protein [Bryobacteraceae bacterium]
MPDQTPPVPPPRVPLQPGVSFESRVTRGISLEVLTAFHAAPPGNEAGGLLLGDGDGDPLLVTDFEPVLCEHRYGPSFRLCEDDWIGLEESVEWFRHSASDSLRVLGFYRSQTRPDPSPGEHDIELMRRCFADPGSLFLLLKPGRSGVITAELFVWCEQGLRPTGHPMLFPSDHGLSGVPVPPMVPLASGPPSPPAVIEAEKIPNEAKPEPALETERRPLLPPARPRRLETQEIGGRNWKWAAAVAVLTVGAAILGYRSVTPRSAEPPPEPFQSVPSATPNPATEPAPPPVSKPAPPPASAPSPHVAETAAPPALSPVLEQAIRDAIEQWGRAIRSGDSSLIEACYAPHLDHSQAAVTHAPVQTMERYGKPAILRITNLTVTPLAEDRVVASFRKHWQTSGPRFFAGEEQERLTFVRTRDAWKIASEEETKVYWTQRPHA